MTRLKVFIVLTVLILISIIVIWNQSRESDDFSVIGESKKLPYNFHEIAYERTETPYFSYLVQKASTQEEYAQVGDLFRMSRDLPDVDFQHSSVIFMGLHESGSCPVEITDGEYTSDNKKMRFAVEITREWWQSAEEIACTSDQTPKTFVIEIDREDSEGIHSIIIEDEETVTSIAVP